MNPARRFIAVALGVVTVLCTLLWILTFALIVMQSVAGVYESPVLGVGVLVVTFPPALLCTIVALVLVGPRRCKLAWISFCIYVLPLVFTLGAMFVDILWNTIKRHL